MRKGHSNKIKQEFGLTDIPKVRETIFRVNAGTKRRGSPCYTPPFGLPYRWVGMQ